jgi:transposase
LGSHHKEGSTKMSKHSMVAAGIDTSKHKLDVALAWRSEELQVSNDAAGFQELAAWLRQHRIKRVGIEASGGYERPVVAHLRGKGFLVIVFQPLQVRAYAGFRLRRAKNDKIDARLIAECASEAKDIHDAPDPRLEPLSEHLTLIDQIDEDIARTKTRLEGFRDPQLRTLVQEEIKRLKLRRSRELKSLISKVRKHPDLAHRLDLIESVQGIGPRTAVALLVRMPELGSISREQAAALAGLAPFDDDSGEHEGNRHIAGGRARLRTSLYAAALPAAFQWNPHAHALYTRLRAAGKCHKVALVACARKLLIFANAVVARDTPWVPLN